jgi:uncharacterized protein (UPF0264 family)
MCQLMVSVRSAAEAEAALEGGADLLDIKEPLRGPLGQADDATVAEILDLFSDRATVSAAQGELLDSMPRSPDSRLRFVKWGLAGANDPAHWQQALSQASLCLTVPGPRLVAVAYADWQRAGAPNPEALCAWACDHGVGAFMVDTWRKNGGNLLDWLLPKTLEHFVEHCRGVGIPVAFAGSLGSEQVATLLPLKPDWIAVRGAVCSQGQRENSIDATLVRELVGLLSPGAKIHPVHAGVA